MAIAIGMVHGRFQPFHRGHLEYAVLAAARCDSLVVGITNPDPDAVQPEAASGHRHLPESNPFTYVERLAMAQDALAEALPGRVVRIVPFPISEPERWPSYVPPGTEHFIRVQSDWSAEKAARLTAAGYTVHVLPDGDGSAISGIEVRQRLESGGDWRALVPPAVARHLEAYT